MSEEQDVSKSEPTAGAQDEPQTSSDEVTRKTKQPRNEITAAWLSARKSEYFAIGITLFSAFLLAVQTNIFWQQTRKLEESNKLFEKQNSLSAFEQTSGLRTLLYRESNQTRTVRLEDFPVDTDLKSEEPQWPAPNPAVVQQISVFGAQQEQIVVEALEPLLLDEAVSVSSGALLALQQMEKRKASGANLRGADLTRKGARPGGVGDGQDLAGFDLAEALAATANLTQARLTDAMLNGADLRASLLDKTDLARATLNDARLRGASLVSAKLNDADLSGADLTASSLAFAKLGRANLKGAHLSKANLSNADLQGIQNWLDIADIEGAILTGVQNAPAGFMEWALERGASN